MARASALALAIVSGCAPTGGPTTMVAPERPNASTATAEELPPASPPNPAPSAPEASAPAPTAKVVEPGFDVTLSCAPQLCGDDPWLRVDFENTTPSQLVLDVPAKSASTRTWSPSRVSAQWSNGTGFGSITPRPLRSTHYVPAWDGEAVAVRSGYAESFDVVLDETANDDLYVELELSWRQSATPSPADVQDAKREWVVKREVGEGRRGGCVPVTCDITIGN